MQSFSERMAEAKELAQVDRNRGQHVGKPAAGWNYKRPDPTGLDRLEWEYTSWRKEWQYQCVAAVESALFAAELEDIARWL
jgi:hypothetical protein